MSFSDPLVSLLFTPGGDTSISDICSFFTPSNSGFSVMIAPPFSSPRLLFEPSFDSCRSDVVAGEHFPSADPLPA